MNRVRILAQGEVRWLTAPIDRTYHGFKDVKDMEFHSDPRWRTKMLKTLEAAYRRAPYFQETFAMIAPLIEYPDEKIARYNEHAIRIISTALGIDQAKLVRGSGLTSSGSSTDLLISLTLGIGGHAYMCGGGADGYQDESAFGRAGVSLVRQQFQHPTYFQHGQEEFHPGLSIVDALVNLGIEGVKKILTPN